MTGEQYHQGPGAGSRQAGRAVSSSLPWVASTAAAPPGGLPRAWGSRRPHRLLQQLRRLLELTVQDSLGFLRRHKHGSGLR